MASKRLRAFQSDEGEGLAIDMSPMIDMVFLLLIFFLVNASMVIVKMDKQIQVPVAKNAEPQEEKNGRIVMNVYKDGSFAPEDYETTTFGENAEDDILDYIKTTKEEMEDKGYTPTLHLRGDQDALFKHSRKVIRISARAGVSDVKFATYVSQSASDAARK